MVVVGSPGAAQQARRIPSANPSQSFGGASVSFRPVPWSPVDRGGRLTLTTGPRGLAGVAAGNEAMPAPAPVIPTRQHVETEVGGEPSGPREITDRSKC